MSADGVIESDVEAIDMDTKPPNGNGSRFNAVKHGLWAKTPVFPGEDGDEFQALVETYKASLGTRNQYEDDLAKCAALANWQLDRAVRVEADRANREVASPTGPVALALQTAQQAKDDVRDLGSRLFHDRRGPIELYPSRDYTGAEPRTSAPDTPTDPENPARIVEQLESTTEGCRWLLARWRELVETPVGWLPPQKLKAIRLLG
jgi:hypothetical protein